MQLAMVLVVVPLPYSPGVTPVCWHRASEAVAGCDYLLHVASPFPAGVPAHEDELIVPARAGTLRVLRAASRRIRPSLFWGARTPPIRSIDRRRRCTRR